MAERRTPAQIRAEIAAERRALAAATASLSATAARSARLALGVAGAGLAVFVVWRVVRARRRR